MRLRKPHRFRVVLLAGLFVGLGGVVVSRLYTLQYTNHDTYATRANQQHVTKVVIYPERGDILDTNGQPLAQSTIRYTVNVNPRFFRSQHDNSVLRELSNTVAKELGAFPDDIYRKFQIDSTSAVLASRIRSQSAKVLSNLLDEYDPNANAHWLDRVSTRMYPKGIASPVLGFCQRGGEGDNRGLAGLELQYDAELRGRKITTSAVSSGRRQSMDAVQVADLASAQGNTLNLTLDARLQESVEKSLSDGVEKANAQAGAAVVMDVHSGAVLAMANYPTFDNNQFSKADSDSRRNRALTDPLETGSVAKLFTAAILIDNGFVTPDTRIDCEGGYWRWNRRNFRDSPGHYLEVATFREVLRNSSNIGIVKAAQVLDDEPWYHALRDLGFGHPTGIDLPGEDYGILRHHSKWTEYSRGSLPMGYEMALTPVQITAALSALVNGGNYYTPYVVDEVRDPHGDLVYQHKVSPERQVFRPTTSNIMRDLMEDIAVLGTGKNAQVQGHRIGGKTGTTRKSQILNRREYIASFGGALPINDPRVAIYLYIDDPQGTYYASSVAAPVFQEIAEACIVHLGIPPTEDIMIDDVPVAENSHPSISPEEERLLSRRHAILGRMPDFSGMSISEVRNNLPPKIKAVTMLGSGKVADQLPSPGETFNDSTELTLHFASSTERAAGEGGGK